MKKVLITIALIIAAFATIIFATPIDRANLVKLFGSYTGDGGTDAGDSIYADMVLAQTDLDAILADTGTAGVVIANDGITAAKIAADAVTTAELATGCISADEVADSAIDAGAMATDAIGAAELAADCITTAEIANNAITTTELATDCITSDELAATAVAEIAASGAISTSNPSYTNANYLAVSTGTLDTTGVWSTVAAHEIAVVTGCVKMLIIAECTVSVASVGDNGTIALGDETTTNSIIAASTLGSGVMVAGELWVDATLTRTILTQTQLNAVTFVVANGKDIGYTVATNALASGTIKFHIWWTPLDATGNVTAGAGGAF